MPKWKNQENRLRETDEFCLDRMTIMDWFMVVLCFYLVIGVGLVTWAAASFGDMGLAWDIVVATWAAVAGLI